MAWIYLAESAESPLPWNLGSHQSPTVKETATLKGCCCQEWPLMTSTELRYGTTLHRLEEPCYQVSMSFPEGFPARTSVLRELEKAWLEADQGYFSKSSDSLANFDLDSFSWKTSQLSLFGGLTEFLWSSLRWGSTVGGRLYQPQRWEPSTFENAGSYLPTPTACDYGKNVGRNVGSRDRYSLTMRAKHGTLPNHPKGKLNPEYLEQMMGYPIQWTELEDWAMQWFRPKREKRL
jgi:hypothetical protein